MNTISGGTSTGNWLWLHHGCGSNVESGDTVRGITIVDGSAQDQTVTTDHGVVIPSAALGLTWGSEQ